LQVAATFRAGPGRIASGVTLVPIVTNTPPVAGAGPAQTVLVGATAHLDGSQSSDVDGDALRFQWTFTTVPAGSVARLSDPTAVQPTFVADRAGTYTVQLIVNDGIENGLPTTVQISTENSPPEPFVTHLACTAYQQTGDVAFHYRSTIARSTGQLDLMRRANAV
jgi:hypothetical protein